MDNLHLLGGKVLATGCEAGIFVASNSSDAVLRYLLGVITTTPDSDWLETSVGENV